jgi:hypothetical protein
MRETEKTVQQSQRGACHKNILIRKPGEPHPDQRQRLRHCAPCPGTGHLVMTVLFFILDNFRDSSGILFEYYVVNINGREKVISPPASNDRLVFFLLFYGCKRMGCLRLNPGPERIKTAEHKEAPNKRR